MMLYLTYNSTDLSVGLHSDVAITIFDGTVVVGHIAADSTKLVVAAFVLPHATSHHGTMFDGAVVVHSAADSTDVTVVSIASMDVHIHQFEVLDSAVVHLAEESTIVVVTFDFQVSDDVPLSVECSAKLSDGMAVEVDIVHIQVVHQQDGIAFVALVVIIIIIPQSI